MWFVFLLSSWIIHFYGQRFTSVRLLSQIKRPHSLRNHYISWVMLGPQPGLQRGRSYGPHPRLSARRTAISRQEVPLACSNLGRLQKYTDAGAIPYHLKLFFETRTWTVCTEDEMSIQSFSSDVLLPFFFFFLLFFPKDAFKGQLIYITFSYPWSWKGLRSQGYDPKSNILTFRCGWRKEDTSLKNVSILFVKDHCVD